MTIYLSHDHQSVAAIMRTDLLATRPNRRITASHYNVSRASLKRLERLAERNGYVPWYQAWDGGNTWWRRVKRGE